MIKTRLQLILYTVLGFLIKVLGFFFVVGKAMVTMYGICLFEIVVGLYAYDHFTGERLLNMDNFDKIILFTLFIDFIRCVIAFFDVLSEANKEMFGRKGD